MKKHLFTCSIAFCAMLVLSACGGGTKETTAETVKETTAAVETTAAKPEKKSEEKVNSQAKETKEEETEEHIDEEDEDTSAPEMTSDLFIQYFDLFLEDNEIAKKDFYLEYNGDKYKYDDLEKLFHKVEEAGGTVDVSIMGEEEDMLDLEIMAGYLEFINGWDSGNNTSGLGNIDQDFIDRFHGDWHGMLGFRDCTGKYKSQLDGDNVTSIARFIIDSDGYVVPFIGVHVEDTPIMSLEATLEPDDDCMYLSGSWIDVDFDRIPMTEKDGTLHCEIPISKDSGSLTMVFNFRHLNDTGWTDEDPALPKDYIENCQGWSFDKLAESNGYTSWDYPSYSSGEEPDYPVQIEKKDEKEDYGKTTKDADGVVSLKQLQSAYKWLNGELDNKNHAPLTYEVIRDKLGVDGKKQSPAQWTSERHKYEWKTSDEKEWMDIFFTVGADGSETFAQVNPSSGLE